MTKLTRAMIEAFPVANLHVHLPGAIPAETALELGLRNNLITIRNGKIVPRCSIPVPEYVRYKTYADIFAEGYEFGKYDKPTNLRYDVAQGTKNTFVEFDQVMGIVQGHRYHYYDGDKRVAVGGIQTPDDVRLVLDSILTRCLTTNVKYIELKQNTYLSEIIFPDLSKNDSLNAFAELLDDVQKQFREHGVALYFCQCFNKSSEITTEQEAIDRSNMGIDDLLLIQKSHPNLFVKIDSAGNEKLPLAHPRFQRKAYHIARRNGIVGDAHAAEANHFRMLMDTVEHLNVGIIGHGIQVVESKAALSYARERGLIFMVCPAMNMFLGTNLNMHDGSRIETESLWQHPFWQMLREEGLKVSLATDNPDLGGVPFKQMLMQLAGLAPESVGHPPHGTKPLSAEELYRVAHNGLGAIPNMVERISYEHELKIWAKSQNLAHCVANTGALRHAFA